MARLGTLGLQLLYKFGPKISLPMVSNRLLSTSCSIIVQPRVCVAGLELVDGIRKTNIGSNVSLLPEVGLHPWLRQLMLNFKGLTSQLDDSSCVVGLALIWTGLVSSFRYKTAQIISFVQFCSKLCTTFSFLFLPVPPRRNSTGHSVCILTQFLFLITFTSAGKSNIQDNCKKLEVG